MLRDTKIHAGNQTGKLNCEPNTRKALAVAGCVQKKITPSLWKYIKHNFRLTIVVDDLGVKHVGKKLKLTF